MIAEILSECNFLIQGAITECGSNSNIHFLSEFQGSE
jgi:hypothetical protein